jgi:acyl dehydratase
LAPDRAFASGAPGASAPPGAPVRVGERVTHVTRYRAEDIARFAALTLDRNPVHHDRAAARRAGQHDVIASGQHTSALMSGLAATYFTRDDDGLAREMLCLNFNFAYKAPIHADRDVRLAWEVSEVEWNASLRGHIAQLAGEARVDDVVAVVARGTVLVRAAGAADGEDDRS